MVDTCICGTTFTQPVRGQGGGAYRKYCSSRCRSRNWASKNPIKVDTSKFKHASKPESKEKKKQRQKRYRFERYQMDEDKFLDLLTRQLNRCQICKKGITEKSAKIDHCHKTNIVRGLLCNRCNLTLGLLEDSKVLLSNMVAYVERDISKTYLYLVGSLRNTKVPIVANELRKNGLEVFDQWYGAGETADDSWQAYSKQKGLTYTQALKDTGAQTVFHFDRSRIEMSDIVVLLMPAGKSGHLELGYAAGLGKKTYILYDGEPERYDVMPQFAKDGVFFKIEDLLNELGKSPSVGCDSNIWLNSHGIPVSIGPST